MEKYEQSYKSTFKQIVVNNFIGGIFWGLGVTVGLSILFAILGVIFSKINLIPVIGGFVSQITNFVLQNNPHLIK